jgi:hypothetical protein
MTCTQIATIPRNNASEANAAASSAKIRNMQNSPVIRTKEEHSSYYVLVKGDVSGLFPEAPAPINSGFKVGQNLAAGVAGLVVWPLLFAMDFEDSAGKEVAALQSRQQYLATPAEQRCAAAATAQPAPARKR